MEKMTLDRLAVKYRTDKSTKKVTEQSPKGYTLLYEKYFEAIRFEPLRILEIGVKTGASIKMWHDYFPNSEIIGIDIKKPKGLDSIAKIHIGDQTDIDFLREIKDAYGEIDIVIDDGGHLAFQQITSFVVLSPIVKYCYVIEDLHKDRNGGTFNVIYKVIDSINSRLPEKTKYKSVHFYKSIVFLWM